MRPKLPPAPNEIRGEIVDEWSTPNYYFQLERLPEPRRVGAGDRYFRLWLNGEPCSGGQWHYTEEGARRHAAYVCESTSYGKITRLRGENALLEARLREARLREARLHQAQSFRLSDHTPAFIVGALSGLAVACAFPYALALVAIFN